MKYFWLIVIGITCITFQSCKKYLDEKSNSSLVIPSTVEDLQALLDYPELINYGTPMFGEASCDDYFILDSRYNLYNGTKNGDAYTWKRFDYNFPNDWSTAYRPVYYSNLCLETIENVIRTSQNASDWDNVKGSALFLRAYYFLNLAWTFAKAYHENSADNDLGIVLRLNSDFNIPSVRSSVKATYDQVILNAKQAILFLPVNPVHAMRPSRAAAYGLLARAYLSMRYYDSAFKYADLALSINDELINFNNPDDVIVGNTSPYLDKFHKEVIFYSQINNSFLTVSTNTPALVDGTLFSFYSTGDLRRTAFFRPSGANWRFKNYNSGFEMFSGIATNEMYLIRAECYARGGHNDGAGDKEAALTDLNTLLEKRWQSGSFIPFTANTPVEALNIILLERRKELLRRGLRWIDIKRLNVENSNISLVRNIAGETYKLEHNDDRFALPIPRDIIDQTGISQN